MWNKIRVDYLKASCLQIWINLNWNEFILPAWKGFAQEDDDGGGSGIVAGVIPFFPLHLSPQRAVSHSLWFFKKTDHEMSGSSVSTSVEETLFSRTFPFNRGSRGGCIMLQSCSAGDTLVPTMLPVWREWRQSSLWQWGKQGAGRLPPSLCAPKPQRWDPCTHCVPGWERAPSSPRLTALLQTGLVWQTNPRCPGRARCLAHQCC